MTTVTAEVICDSISEAGIRLTTMQLTYPRVIHAEFMTHRAFSRNAASSRAIPIEKSIRLVEADPYIPIRWGLNGKGMQDHGAMSEIGQAKAEKIYRRGLEAALATAKEFLVSKEVPHKQIVNRILEPYSHITVVVTATEWNNFFALRDHAAADPLFQLLAAKMKEAYTASVPKDRKTGDWHLPYLLDRDVERATHHVLGKILPKGDMYSEAWLEEQVKQLLFKMSAARCARVSYLNQDKETPTVEEDLATFAKLMAEMPLHASPTEHQAEPDIFDDAYSEWIAPHLHGNFVGWCQYRKTFVGENVATNRR